MQEPSMMREEGLPQLAQMFPVGIVINQETVSPRRVQVRIPAVHTDVPDEDLPYYHVLHSTEGNGHNGRSKRTSTLAKGTHVMVLLYDPRGYNGVVMGVIGMTTDDDSLYAYRDELGNSFEVDSEGSMTLTGVSGASLKLSKDGVADVVLAGLNIHVGDMTISGDMLTVLMTTFNTTATDWTVSATNPAITDGQGGGGGSGTAPTLTPPTLPEAPDVSNKTDI